MLRIFALFLCLLGSCSPNNGGSNTTSQDNTGPLKTKADLFIKLDHKLVYQSSPTFYLPFAKSGDEKWLYIAPRGYDASSSPMVAFEIGSDLEKDAQDQAHYHKLSFDNSSFDDSPGKAKVPNNHQGQYKNSRATKDGLSLVLTNTNNSKFDAALLYQGKDLAYAWKNRKKHIFDIEKTDSISNFFIVEHKDGGRLPFIYGNKKLFKQKANNTNYRFTHALLNKELKAPATKDYAKAGLSSALFEQTEQQVFLVSNIGLSIAKHDDIFAKKIGFSHLTDTETTAKYGAETWRMTGCGAAGAVGTENNNVNTIIAHAGFLYLGFSAPHNNCQGGVAIYDIAADTMKGPEKSIWNGINIKQLIKDENGLIWAVSSKALIEVKSDGSMGQKLDAASVKNNQIRKDADKHAVIGQYLGDMPADDIFTAMFVKGGLFIATDKNLYVMVKDQAHTLAVK